MFHIGKFMICCRVYTEMVFPFIISYYKICCGILCILYQNQECSLFTMVFKCSRWFFSSTGSITSLFSLQWHAHQQLFWYMYCCGYKGAHTIWQIIVSFLNFSHLYKCRPNLRPHVQSKRQEILIMMKIRKFFSKKFNQ